MVLLEDGQDLVEEDGNVYSAPFVRAEHLQEHPEVAEILDLLSEQLRIEDLWKTDYANVTHEAKGTEEAMSEYLEENLPPGN